MMCVAAGDSAELHDHSAGAAGPAAGNCRCQRAAAAGGEEEPADRRGRQQQAPAQGHRGQDPAGPVHVRGQHPGG